MAAPALCNITSPQHRSNSHIIAHYAAIATPTLALAARTAPARLPQQQQHPHCISPHRISSHHTANATHPRHCSNAFHAYAGRTFPRLARFLALASSFASNAPPGSLSPSAAALASPLAPVCSSYSNIGRCPRYLPSAVSSHCTTPSRITPPQQPVLAATTCTPNPASPALPAALTLRAGSSNSPPVLRHL